MANNLIANKCPNHHYTKLSTIVYKCIHGAAPSYLTNLCVPVATNTSRRYLRSATHGDLLVPRMRKFCDLWTMKFCCFRSYCLENFAVDTVCIDHYARTVSEWSKDNTVPFGLRDMIRRFRDCLGR